MTKIYSILFILSGLFLSFFSTRISANYYNLNIGLANLISLVPMLLVSIAALLICDKKVKKVTVSDIIVPAVLIHTIGATLVIITMIIESLRNNRAFVSNVFLLLDYSTVILIIIVAKKINNKKFSKVSNIVGLLLYLVGAFGSILNCFFEVIKAG